jgi:hypothetical protein
MKILFITVFVILLYCADIYISVEGNTNSDCGTSMSYACATFSSAYTRRSGTTFFVLFCFLRTFLEIHFTLQLVPIQKILITTILATPHILMVLLEAMKYQL